MAMTISIIVEWENTLLAEMRRPIEMLRRLQEQAAAIHSDSGTTFELLIAFNDEDIDESIPLKVVKGSLNMEKWPGEISFERATGCHYYELKNYAADRAKGDIIIFLDSDVVPEDGWLGSLLSRFEDETVKFVAGNTYMSTEDFIGKCFAVFWTFRPRQPLPDKHVRPSFYANNIAFRRQFFLENKFPVEHCYRGQCGALAKQLRNKGLQILHDGRAWVSHPAPNGFSHFVTRAIAKGHDNVFWSRRKHGALAASPAGAMARFLSNIGTTLFRMVTRSPKIGIGPIEAICGAAVGFAYHSIVFVSELVAFFSPQLIRRHIHI
jgi:hypothetical protein